MLQNYIKQFLNYCQASNFSAKSLEALSARLNKFSQFFQTLALESIADIRYQHLLSFVADFDTPSVHLKKSRVWALRQFYHFLKLNKIIDDNLATQILYPKIEKKVPKYLPLAEFNQILGYFAGQAQSTVGLRDLIIIMLFGFLGLRLSAVLKLNIEDVHLNSALIRIQEKGNVKRHIALPEILCKALSTYLGTYKRQPGPLLLSKRKKRISERSIQDLLRTAMNELGIKKHLHAHLFRHTAATYLTKVAGPAIAQHVLGHARRNNTEQYTHLNPDIYASYMKKHPYMNL